MAWLHLSSREAEGAVSRAARDLVRIRLEDLRKRRRRLTGMRSMFLALDRSVSHPHINPCGFVSVCCLLAAGAERALRSLS